MRPAFWSFVLVIGMVIASFVLYVVSFIPGIVDVGITDGLAATCTPPESFPASAGNLVAADLREAGNPTRFINLPREAWVEQRMAELASETKSNRDLVVYVHGFRTSFTVAKCAGNNLRADLAGLPSYATSGGPDIFVLGWPGEFSVLSFGSAKENAIRAGHYLASVLEQVKNRRIILVSHSLGAEVVMTAAGDLPEPVPTPPLAGILLVEGAIPALSIRSWRSVLTETYPRTDAENAMEGKPPKAAFVEIQTGVGRFVSAATRASHLVVTTAGGDSVLANPFKLHETFLSSDKDRLMTPGEIGDDAGNWISAQAIGIPFRTGGIHRHYEQLVPDLELHEHSKFDDLPKIFPTDPWKVMNADDWDYEFKVEHPSYHEIPLSGDWWRLFKDWHGVMNDEVIRRRILSESWAFFDGKSS
jgi:pimeloyl-ACP methyl ester carboxylesterase